MEFYGMFKEMDEFGIEGLKRSDIYSDAFLNFMRIYPR